jgi:hypothetical protein
LRVKGAGWEEYRAFDANPKADEGVMEILEGFFDGGDVRSIS